MEWFVDIPHGGHFFPGKGRFVDYVQVDDTAYRFVVAVHPLNLMMQHTRCQCQSVMNEEKGEVMKL